LVLVAISFAFTVHAQKVALHSGGNVSIFNGTTAIVSAYNQAVSGDTIYIPGGSFTAPTLVNKKLVIYGAGHYPDSTEVTGKSIWNGNLTLGADADNIHIEGIEVNGNFYFTTNAVIDNVTIAYCKINGNLDISGTFATPSNNLQFYGNVILMNILLSNAENALLANNIIGLGVSSSDGNSFFNNIFLSKKTTGSYEHFANSDNNMICNNVFYTPSSYGESGNNNVFRNNLYTNTEGLGTNPTVSGNYFNVVQSSIFVNVSSSGFSYTANYHLQFPATYFGTDGSEIGIYGGVYFPYKEGAVPSNPHLQMQNISPNTSNGLLNVQIKATAQDH